MLPVPTCRFACYQTYERYILKTNGPILMQIGTSDPHLSSMKRSDVGLSRSKVKVM